MSPSDLIMAIMLLSSPVGTPEQAPSPDRWIAMQAALQHVAVDWEILDARETRYVLAKPEDFQEDLDFLRKRRIDFEGAPRIMDSLRLPPREILNNNIRFNRTYRKNLETRLPWEADRASDIGQVIRETDRLYQIWDAMRDARCDYHYITVRRMALLKLKELVGEDDYLRGEIPPFVPNWRFEVVR